tara:strand:- start:453 stop:587 length:135 start_codon:yes stop_codon:yes gene_type:complete
LKTVEDVIEYVSQHEGGIGFIPEQIENASLRDCKVLKIDSKDKF